MAQAEDPYWDPYAPSASTQSRNPLASSHSSAQADASSPSDKPKGDPYPAPSADPAGGASNSSTSNSTSSASSSVPGSGALDQPPAGSAKVQGAARRPRTLLGDTQFRRYLRQWLSWQVWQLARRVVPGNSTHGYHAFACVCACACARMCERACACSHVFLCSSWYCSARGAGACPARVCFCAVLWLVLALLGEKLIAIWPMLIAFCTAAWVD